MIEIDDALGRILDRIEPLPPRSTPLAETLGLRLGEPIQADRDSPPFDKSMVDGFALAAGQTDSGSARLQIRGTIAAGQIWNEPIVSGQAVRIMTGAAIPPGCDAVVMHERVEVTEQEGQTFLQIDSSIPVGQNVLRRGSEMRLGETIFEALQTIDPVVRGVLATVGRTRATCQAVPRVAIQATGDELVDPHQIPGPGQIRDSNTITLAGLVDSWGGVPVVHPQVDDHPGRLEQALGEGLKSDVLLISGGVSAGQFDLVPPTLQRLGVEPVFHKVRIKPGKPLWFGIGPRRGSDHHGTLVFGLPGNPVSGLVSFLVFVRPALERLMGGDRQRCHPQTQVGTLQTEYRHRGERTTYHPALWHGDREEIDPLPWKGSADLLTVAKSDGFAIFPPGEATYPAGTAVRYLSRQVLEPYW